MCLDPRIGLHCDDPDLGYGGYCPSKDKDAKQLLANYGDVPQNPVVAIVDSNCARKLGAGHMHRVKIEGMPVVVYEPTLDALDSNGRQGRARPRGVQGRV